MPPKKSPRLSSISKFKSDEQAKTRRKTLKKITQQKKTSKLAVKKRQSPIDIHKESLYYDPKTCQKDSLCISYKSGDCCEVTTSENGFRVDVGENCSTTLCAKHLPGTYQLAQFHAHWGSEGSCGSEHMLNGKPMSGEVHFVFWNRKYKSFDKAVEKKDGLAVLGVFLKEGLCSSAYKVIFDAIHQATISKKPVSLSKDFSLENLLPDNRDFVTYFGSLTTPPFSESVIWTVLFEPIDVSKEQLDILRAIVHSNYRECQDLCSRKVLASIETP